MAMCVIYNCNITRVRINLRKGLLTIMLSFIIIFGLVVGLGDYNKKYISSKCLVTNYTETLNNSQIKNCVNVIISNNHQELVGHSGWYCKQNLHNFDEEKYMKCVENLVSKHPIKSVQNCWYKPKNDFEPLYRVYWSDQTNTYFVPLMIVTSILIIIVYFSLEIARFLYTVSNDYLQYVKDILTFSSPESTLKYHIYSDIPYSLHNWNPPPLYNVSESKNSLEPLIAI